MVISSPCLIDIKNWLVQKQTAFGKDFLNPFIADSFLKTILFSTHHASQASCYSNESLAIPEQTATGKEISNRVYEDKMKTCPLSSTSNSQNLAFLSSENTSITNEVSTASGNFKVNTAGETNSSSQVSSTPGADEVVCSFFAQQTTSPPLNNEDLQQIDQDDLEELAIRWHLAMLTVKVQRYIQKTGRNLDFKGKQPVTFDKSKVECYNYHRKGHFAKECKSGRKQGKRSYGDNGRRNATTNEPSSQALVAQDGLEGYD
ncbi:retrovirus-related pol polyprotein from transposon TNT 1-94 [Tanacetum coccineum]